MTQLTFDALHPAPDGAYLRDLLRIPFTDDQLAVATQRLEPQLVVAGAGSGKTMVMAARVVHLVAQHHIPPSAILGLTFTNKAAGELGERVRVALAKLGKAGLLPAGSDPAAGYQDDQPTVSTYHAYAAGLVADHALRIGREPRTQLLTEATRWQLAARVVREATGPFAQLDWTPAFVARYLLELDGEMSEHLVSPEQVREVDAELLTALRLSGQTAAKVKGVGQAAETREELVTLVEDYRRRKVELDLIDYGDQVALAAEVALADAEVGRLERERYRVVLLDEYQDTGVAQRLLLTALYGKHHPVTAVGDPCQAIYGWRGASVGNLLRFPQHFPLTKNSHCDPQYLMTSFRSGGRLLRTANALSTELREPPTDTERTHLSVPVLSAEPDRAEHGDTRCALLQTVGEEADWVAGEIAAAVAGGVAYGEAAVLCRRRSDFAALHAALIAHGLPVEVVGLGGLLEMPEVADVVATLRLLVDPTANPALVRLLTGPRWRIGPRDLAALGARATGFVRADGGHGPVDAAADPDGHSALGADQVGTAALREATAGIDTCDLASLLDALDSLGEAAEYSSAAYARLLAFRDEVRTLRPLVRQPVVDAVTEVVRAIGLDVEIEASPEPAASARAANLAAFLDHAAHYTGLDGESDLPGFLAYLDAAADAENGLDAGGVSAADTVKLLTVHRAKGLEWDVVAVPGLVKDVFPSNIGRSRWTSAARVLPYRLRGDKDDLPRDPEFTGPALGAFEAECRAEAAIEERRLAYVAMTRARTLLLCSGYWWGLTQKTAKGPSVFLDEVRTRCLDGDGTVVEWVEEPVEGNPNVAASGDLSWPAPYDVDAATRRRAVATAVLDAIEEPTSMPDTELSPVDYAQLQTWRAESALLLAEARQVGAPERLVPLPTRLTASQVVALQADPAALARTLARPLPQRPVPEARRGTRFHSWVEGLFGEHPLLDDDALPGAADTVGSDEELAALQQTFLDSPFSQVRPLAMEAPFELLVGGRLVRGRIDAVYQTPDGFDVIDYKTGGVPRNFVAASLQLSVYRLAWAQLAGVDPMVVTAGFLYIRDGLIKRPEHLHSLDELAYLIAGTPSGSEVGAPA